jgi:hypothetical protein
VACESVEAAAPQRAIGLQPDVHVEQRLGTELVPPALGLGTNTNETGVAQDPEVLGDAGLAEAEQVDELTHEPGPFPQEVEDPAPLGLDERLEGRGCHDQIFLHGYIAVKEYSWTE